MRPRRTDNPYQLRKGANVDPGVIVRALRFVAELHGYAVRRGDYMGRDSNRADRYYLVPLAAGYEAEREIKERRRLSFLSRRR